MQRQGAIGRIVPKKWVNLRYGIHKRESSRRGVTMEDIRWQLNISDMNRIILESIATGVFVTDANARIIMFNKAAEEILGIPREQALGSSYFRTLGEQSRDALIQSFDYSVKSGKPYLGREVELVTVLGKNVILKPFISPVRDSEGTILGMVIVFDDVTEKHQLEEQIRRADKLTALGHLAIGVAHEIRNPLGSIMGFAQLIQRDLPPGDPMHEVIDIIIREAERLGKVTQELLDFARPAKIQFAFLKVNWVVEKALFLIEMENTNNEIKYIRRYGDVIPEIFASMEQVQQVIINLLQNSIQAIGTKGTITVSTRQVNESWVEVAISDTGEGILPENLNKIFDPFFTTRLKGTGMGLSIVHQIMTRHGGCIQVRSNPKKGTTFVLRFPVKAKKD